MNQPTNFAENGDCLLIYLSQLVLHLPYVAPKQTKPRKRLIFPNAVQPFPSVT